MVDKILSVLLVLLGAPLIIGALAIMFGPPRDAAGVFLFVAGAVLVYQAGKIWSGPTRPFEDQVRDYGLD